MKKRILLFVLLGRLCFCAIPLDAMHRDDEDSREKGNVDRPVVNRAFSLFGGLRRVASQITGRDDGAHSVVRSRECLDPARPDEKWTFPVELSEFKDVFVEHIFPCLHLQEALAIRCVNRCFDNLVRFSLDVAFDAKRLAPIKREIYANDFDYGWRFFWNSILNQIERDFFQMKLSIFWGRETSGRLYGLRRNYASFEDQYKSRILNDMLEELGDVSLGIPLGGGRSSAFALLEHETRDRRSFAVQSLHCCNRDAFTAENISKKTFNKLSALGISELSFEGLFCISGSGALCFPSTLEELLFPIRNIGSLVICSLSEGCKRLKALELSADANIHDHFDKLPPTLTSFSLVNAGDLNQDKSALMKAFNGIAEACPALELLELHDYQGAAIDWLSYFVQNKRLEASPCIGKVASRLVGRDVSLRRLRLVNCRALNNLNETKQKIDLKELVVEDCPGISRQFWGSLPKDLEVLSVFNRSDDTSLWIPRADFELKEICQCCSMLKELTLVNCLDITNEGLKFLPKTLELVVLERVNRLDDDACITVCNCCPNISRLVVNNCMLRNPKAVSCLPNQNLRELTLSFAFGVDGSRIVSIIGKRLGRDYKKLEKLTLLGCTDVLVSCLKKHLPTAFLARFDSDKDLYRSVFHFD